MTKTIWCGIILIVLIALYASGFYLEIIEFIEGLGRGASFIYYGWISEPSEDKLAESLDDGTQVVEGSSQEKPAVAEDDLVPAFSLLETTDEIKDYIRLKANFLSVDPDLALKIADCESNFRNVCNEQYGCIGGIGVYQIVQSTFDEAMPKASELLYPVSQYIQPHYRYDDPYEIDDNISVALWMMSQGEYWRWEASSKCWGDTFDVIFNQDL